MKKSRSILSQVIHGSELPSHPFPTVPLVEIIGFSRVLIENHVCISSYSIYEIDIKVKQGVITVCGEGLHIARMSPEQLVITGTIQRLHMQGGSH